MWSDHGMIQPHAKYRHHEQVRSRSEKIKLPASAPNGQNVGIQPLVSGNTLHTHAKYRRRKRAIRRLEKKKTFEYFVRSQAAGGAQDGQNVARNLMLSVDT
jgi:hypothetical protein